MQYRVIETVPVEYVYIVDAKSPSDAIDLVCAIDISHSSVEIYRWTEAKYDVGDASNEA